MAATGEPRYVYANAGRALNEGFAENRSDSAKYSLVSFVPLFLLENLTRFANAFFLVVGLMQMLPAITVTGGYPSQLAPLAFVLLFDAVITVVEDASRHGDDFRANNRQVLVARPRPDPTAAAPLGPSRRGAARSHATAAATAAAGGRAAGSETAAASSSGRASAGGFESIPWQAVRVGDVIRLRRGEVAPADCVLLGSRTATGAVAPDACYVQTAQLDGETNLKVRRAPALPKGIRRWHVPSPSDPASVALDASCLILRGAEVRSVDVAWALVVYTGSDSKVRVAQSQGAFKRPTSEGYLNRAIGVLALLLVAVCVATTFAWVVWASDSDDGTFRTSVLRDETATPDVLGAVTMAGTQFLLQAGLIPVSLYVSVRLVRTVSALLLARDRSLLPGSAQRMAEHIASASDAPGDAGGCCCCGCFARCGLTDNVNSALAEFSGGVPQHVRVRTMDLLDELGQITHVFSDKTGTLTRNSMVLRQLWAGGAQYGLSAAPAAGAGGCTAGGGANAGAPGAGSGAQTAAGLLADAVAGSSDGVPMPPAYPWEGSDSEDDSAEPGARHARSAASGVMIPFSAASGGSAGGAGEGPSRGPAGTRHARGASDSYAPLDGGLPSPSASASPGAGLAAASKAETSGAAPAWTPPAIGAEVRGPNVRFVDGSTSHPGRFLATDSAAAADLILHTDVSAEVATAGAPAARRAAGGDGGADAAAAGQQGAPAASGHEDDGEQAAAAVRRLLINMAINHSVIIEPSESGQNQPRPGQTAPERGRRETVGSDSGAMTGTIGQSRSASFAGRPARARTGSSAGGLLPGGGASRGSSGGWSGYTLSASSPDEAAFVQAAARLGVTFLARKGQWTAVEQGQLKRWGGTGLRTLCFAGRAMEDGEAADWSKRFAAAWSDLDAQRKRRAGDETGVLGKLAAEAERDLSLHGATAVEDQLQLGVPETLALLARAGVAVSVITGDKADTAVNIAYSSRLLDQHTDVIAATAVLLAALSAADASIVCRARPDQKAAVVRLVREGEPAAVTLAIGDGANDVDMLKAAHVGVGISGAEGSQAANASDFAVARFRMLAPLMLVHGRWFVRRLAAMVLYLLYKNVVYGAALLAFGALSAWSGQRLFVVSVDLAYNVVFTGLPVLVTALFDRDIPAELAVALPSLFTEGRGAPQLGASAFAWWLITGALEGVLVLVVPWLTIGQSVRLVELPSLFAGLADSPPGEAALGHGGRPRRGAADQVHGAGLGESDDDEDDDDEDDDDGLDGKADNRPMEQ
ncbi:hypothetical protein FNF28_03440 [Cafeteria roenbergensis]|uniref:Uncharacterized protein n=1 Tax=Cafeteria roenbergensis TaxID=33653 RepID=A0A5A8DK64_CAFRO|nr:hypothetical protein FNF28_03440 [Cafeteria roenbergensis]